MPGTACGGDYSLDGPVAFEECAAALEACLDKGWLRVIDKTMLDDIEAELRSLGFIGPVYGLPEVDQVDFTVAGAELWKKLAATIWPPGEERPPFAWCQVVIEYKAQFRIEERYCEHSVGIANALRSYAQEGETVLASKTEPIGPWCVYWWDRYASGYRAEIEVTSRQETD
ncbi:MAG: hypothetical protein AB7K24_09165 [Gemmataceae bacterium]